MSGKIRVGISQGDINGIGLEVIIKTFVDPAMEELCIPILFSSQKTASYHRKAMGVEDFSFNIIRDIDQANPKKPNLLNLYEEEVNFELGKSTPSGGKYAFKSLETACNALATNKIDVLVTAPINKHNIQSEEFQFKGHTEYLDQKFAGGKDEALMLMVSDTLKVGLVTGHIPVEKVAGSVSVEKIIKRIKTLNRTLIEDFGVRKPRIAVLGLNPHAGDNGTIGNEDIQVITTAINKAKDESILAYGPYPADGFFGNSTYLQFDAVLAMYHDQGLIPFKTIAFNNGVNYTAGLPVVRTSPDHGTAYAIAGKNIASEESFRKAIYTALDIFRKRNEYKQISANPLKSTPLRKE
ncbi:MAG: 4-hydroxythreonine-4-phosphate dehydrogenase PdxA [Bacteroidetes bacterium]|nr:4-hydroxythreonine-4-phosphate dehydrogenase PdxA [Bacteroidota bacterium]